MKVNSFIRLDNSVQRVLKISDSDITLIDCNAEHMPYQINLTDIECREELSDNYLQLQDINELSPKDKEIAIKRYSMIANAIADYPNRNLRLRQSAKIFNYSYQTLKRYYCRYLVYQNISALAPKHEYTKSLTPMQKDMRWGLNKFYYTRNQNNLRTAYTMLIRAKYCDSNGNLIQPYPSFTQFRYFYRKTKKIEKYYISRNGIKEYQRNHRPLLGDGVQEYAPTIGMAMLDATVCDIYLVNEENQLIGRPILVVAVDANTSFCLGYSLLWEGGIYSLVQLMQNIITDKVSLCESMGINIKRNQWDISELPIQMITDMGVEYRGKTFEQISELGITVVNLPSYRAELKGVVEKFFDLVQSAYKDSLKGKGVILSDFQERGARDYRKDARLTLSEFEKIVVKTILYYNNRRIIKNYPYTDKMLAEKVRPYASSIWNYKKKNEKNTLISVDEKELMLTLLPRTKGKFTRYGLIANKLRYTADGYKEIFLKGGCAEVAYDQGNASRVWVKESDGRFIEFKLIESRFFDMDLEKVAKMQIQQKELIESETENALKGKIELMDYVDLIADKNSVSDVQLKNIRKNRAKERVRAHKDYLGKIDG